MNNILPEKLYLLSCKEYLIETYCSSQWSISWNAAASQIKRDVCIITVQHITCNQCLLLVILHNWYSALCHDFLWLFCYSSGVSPVRLWQVVIVTESCLQHLTVTEFCHKFQVHFSVHCLRIHCVHTTDSIRFCIHSADSAFVGTLVLSLDVNVVKMMFCQCWCVYMQRHWETEDSRWACSDAAAWLLLPSAVVVCLCDSHQLFYLFAFDVADCSRTAPCTDHVLLHGRWRLQSQFSPYPQISFIFTVITGSLQLLTHIVLLSFHWTQTETI